MDRTIRRRRSGVHVGARFGTCALGFALVWFAPAQAADELPDLGTLASEPVYRASAYYREQVDAPASVTVITSDDIRNFGYRTLGDILRSVRGTHMHNDRLYDILGLRGFARPGDYNEGVSLLINGMRINDPVYDQAMIGSEFPLDVELIERIEYIRGPGSAEYGGNAVFGVINVVTKSGDTVAGTRATLDVGSYGRYAQSVEFGRRYANGANLLLAVSNLDERGPTVDYAPDPANGFAGGSAPGTDFTHAQHAFAKFDFEEFSLTAGFGNRRKGDGVPYAPPYVFGTPESWDQDTESFVNLQYRTDLSSHARLMARAYYGRYAYMGHWPVDNGLGWQVEYNPESADWAGTELRLAWHPDDGTSVVFGVDAQRDLHIDQADYVVPPFTPAYEVHTQSTRVSAFVQADTALSQHLTFTGGLRADHTTLDGLEINPRTGLIYKPQSDTALKLLYGTGERNASYSERIGLSDPSSLRPERVRNFELTLEHQITPRTRFVAAAFAYRIERVVDSVVDPVTGNSISANTAGVLGRGLEAEFEHIGNRGTHWRASAGYNEVQRNDGNTLPDSPNWTVKGNVSHPLPWHDLRLGVDAQWTARQRSFIGPVPSAALVNLTLLRADPGDGWEVSTSVYNLADHHYLDPLPAYTYSATNGSIPQGGREFRVSVTRKF